MSWTYPEPFDVIVMGGGHAGCEAAAASARMGAKTLLLTMNVDTIGKMSCNPAIGGLAKGHIVREIDALGGLMGTVIDRTGIQFRMLNATKGAAVRAPRAQADKSAYQLEMKWQLEQIPLLQIKQGTIEDLLVEKGKIQGVTTKEGVSYRSPNLVIASGTFLRGLLHVGDTNYAGGRAGDKSAVGLSLSLEKLGLTLGRQKTGTPPRVHADSIDFSQTEEQPGEEGIQFSFDQEPAPRLPQISCYITYTNEETNKIILDNLHLSPLYSGKIQSVGPRYCPSIEDKCVRFPDRKRHQIFLEPEGLHTKEVYVNGISSSLPLEVQYAFLRTIPALRNVEIMRPAYAIEYDYVTAGQIKPSLETHKVEGLFLAGQINGTSGYEEAAAQGLLAGVNAVQKLRGSEPFTLKREEAYIGVMIDDLVTKTIEEPYRMFTSRAEHRLLLRQDNADLRLAEHGHRLGLLPDQRYARVQEKKERIAQETKKLTATYKQIKGKGLSLAQLLARPESTYQAMCTEYPEDMQESDEEVQFQVEYTIKYAGYIERQQEEIKRLSTVENTPIPSSFAFEKIHGLRKEAQQQLTDKRPTTVGQAMRLQGVSPADISILLISLKKAALQ